MKSGCRAMPDEVELFFDEFEAVVKKNKVKVENIWTCEEMGVQVNQIGEGSAQEEEGVSDSRLRPIRSRLGGVAVS